MSYSLLKIIGSGQAKEARHHEGTTISIQPFNVPIFNPSITVHSTSGQILTSIPLEDEIKPLALIQAPECLILISEAYASIKEHDKRKKYFATKMPAGTHRQFPVLPIKKFHSRTFTEFSYTGSKEPAVITDSALSHYFTNSPCIVIESPKDMVEKSAHLESKYSKILAYKPLPDINAHPKIISERAKKAAVEKKHGLRLISFTIPSSDVEEYADRQGYSILAAAHDARKDLPLILRNNSEFELEHLRNTGERRSCIPSASYELVKSKYPVYRIHTDLEGRIYAAERKIDN